MYEAVQKNKPLVERIVTVTGDGVKQPGNYRIRLGMPIRELIEIAGGLPSDSAKVILGGPMMGKAVSNLDAPIPKGCSGILILNEAHAHRSETSSCIRCGKCVSACPMGLEPYLLPNCQKIICSRDGKRLTPHVWNVAVVLIVVRQTVLYSIIYE